MILILIILLVGSMRQNVCGCVNVGSSRPSEGLKDWLVIPESNAESGQWVGKGVGRGEAVDVMWEGSGKRMVGD